MNKQMRMTVFVIAVIAILVLATGSAAAKATKTEFSYTLFTCYLETPEKEWFTGDPPEGPVYHWRGQGSFGYFVSTGPPVDWWEGTVTGVSSGDVKFATFTGNVHGTFEKVFDNDIVTGTFAGTWVGDFTGGVLSFSAVGHGTGDLDGMKYFVDLVQLDEIPDPDPCGGEGSAYAASAVLLAPHGNLP